MITSCAPPAYAHAQPSDMVTAAMRAYIEERGRITTMALVGPPGTGKTWDMAGIANRRRESTYRQWAKNIWISCATIDMVDRDELHAAALVGHDIPKDQVRPFVYLDDIGARATDGAITRIYEVLAIRAERGLPTIATLNRDDKDALTERVRSRLAGGLVIDYTGMPDRRRSASSVVRIGKDVACGE